MNRKELEKMFDERFGISQSYERIKDDVFMNDLKQFIFNEMIPEVLNSILPKYLSIEHYREYRNIDCVDDIKEKAKELYNINL